MNVGIVVEGPSDYATYPVLIKRIRDDISAFQIRDCGGRFKLKGAFPQFLREFQRNHAWQIGAAFVIRDSDCKPSQQIEDDLRVALRFEPDFPVEFFTAKCDLETWLLADENAITQVSYLKGKNKKVDPLQFQFESAKAKTLFHAQLWKANLQPTPDVYKEIAQRLDIERTKALCPSFRRFSERVRAC